MPPLRLESGRRSFFSAKPTFWSFSTPPIAPNPKAITLRKPLPSSGNGFRIYTVSDGADYFTSQVSPAIIISWRQV